MACNCHDYPFVPHVPCFEECTRRALSLASFEELTHIFGIPDPVARKINQRNIEMDVQSMEDFGFTSEESQRINEIFSSLYNNQAALEWLQQQFPLFEEHRQTVEV